MAAVAGGVMQMGEVRAAAAAALTPLAADDPDVVLVVDAVSPPCLLILWGDPWLIPRGIGCQYVARLEIFCVASRVEPDPGFDELENMVAHVMGRLQADGYTWPFESAQAPRLFTIGGVNYLACRLAYEVPATLEED